MCHRSTPIAKSSGRHPIRDSQCFIVLEAGVLLSPQKHRSTRLDEMTRSYMMDKEKSQQAAHQVPCHALHKENEVTWRGKQS